MAHKLRLFGGITIPVIKSPFIFNAMGLPAEAL